MTPQEFEPEVQNFKWLEKSKRGRGVIFIEENKDA